MSQKIYQIADWDEKYENADTRKRKTLFWVLVPNRHDGLGFCTIMENEDALEIFGAWILILQVASKADTRGALTSSKGRPYSAQQIATMTRAPVEKISAALDVLVGIGWIICTDLPPRPDEPARHPDEPARHPDAPAGVGKSPVLKRERKKERKKDSPLPPQTSSMGGGGVGIEIPPPLSDDSVFVETWKRWCNYHATNGTRRWGPAMMQEQLDRLSRMTPADAKTSLCDAMMRGWQAPAKVLNRSEEKTEASKPVRAIATNADDAIKTMQEAE